MLEHAAALLKEHDTTMSERLVVMWHAVPIGESYIHIIKCMQRRVGVQLILTHLSSRSLGVAYTGCCLRIDVLKGATAGFSC